MRTTLALRSGLLVALAATLAAAPAQSASIGEVATWATPEELVLDTEGFVEVHIEARIECRPMTGAPQPMLIAAARQSGELEATLTPDNFTVGWQRVAGTDTFVIEHVQHVAVTIDPTEGERASFVWNSAAAIMDPGNRCDASGYGWVADVTPHSVAARPAQETERPPDAADPGLDASDLAGKTPTPGPGVVGVAIAAWAAAWVGRRPS